jgi:serine/threonine-protein kinase SRPK3
MEPLLTISGETPGPSAPKYIVQPINLEALDPKHLTDQACIIDFGESYDSSSPPEALGIPLGYCSPELIFDGSVGVGTDIWALACTIYELRSMGRLVETFDGDDDEVILQMVKLLGKLPEPWWTSWDARHRWFDEDGAPLVDPETGKAFVNLCTIEGLLAPGVHFRIGGRTGRPVDITVPLAEAEILASPLLQMLIYDPNIAPQLTLCWVIHGSNYEAQYVAIPYSFHSPFLVFNTRFS